jgi:hypothetical protein
MDTIRTYFEKIKSWLVSTGFPRIRALVLLVLTKIRPFLIALLAWIKECMQMLVKRYRSLSPLQKKNIAIGVVVFIIILTLIIILLSRSSRITRLTTVTTPTLTPTPTAYPVNRHGKLGFAISSGKKSGPQFAKGFVDPYDVQVGKPQLLSLTFSQSSPVTSVTATWQTDTKQTVVLLKLVEGTATEGRWEGSWICDDTYLYTLAISATASDGKEDNTIDITLR